ncbi:MAG: prepilin-type N-terminal cleavage/methylation domain-containing protein [bacterium]|nr:prepilin-type N-terminal cleavage/methylation domain-containing protein [bacterium]
MPNRNRSAFTLIELLIVVAIIGILAAIAVPNFLNAQIRAKVARVVSDMKTIQTALQSYEIDANALPPSNMARVAGSGDNFHPNEIRLYRLTTPTSYLSSVPIDPFAINNSADFAKWGSGYDYVNSYYNASSKTWSASGAWGYMWRLNSWGPDAVNGWGGQRTGACPNGHPDFVYNSSNGLVSVGDIVWVGPKDSHVKGTCTITNGV